MASLARRLAPAAALGGLAIVIVGVADPALAGHTEATATGQAADATAAQAAPSTTDQSTADQSTADQSTAGQSTADQSTADQSTTDQSTTGQSTTASCDSGDTVTGDSVTTRWGPVQVAATVSGSQVCEVYAVDWPTGDGRSQMISAYAIPRLDSSATASEGTQIDYVSGATYTSDGYARSLQSILDSL